MAINLNKNYMGLQAGTVVGLSTPVESGLIASGMATANASKANITPGAITYQGTQGTVVFGAGASSLVITNPLIDANTKVGAAIAQAAADATMTSIARIVPAAGSVTIYANAAATAATVVDWVIDAAPGLTVIN